MPSSRERYCGRLSSNTFEERQRIPEIAMEIKVPEVGESIREALLAKWHRKSGEAVKADEPVCEIETDKITLEINAETDGILTTLADEGATVKIGQTIGRIEEGRATEVHAADEMSSPPGVMVGKVEPKDPQRTTVSPTERRAAREEKPEPPKQAATGAAKNVPPAGERPVPEQAPLFVEPPKDEARMAPAPKPERGGAEPRETRQPMTPIRRRITEHLLKTVRETASLTTFNEADLSRVTELRARHREHFLQKYGVKLGLMSFFVKAAVEALREFPEVNSSIDGGDIVRHHYYDIGIAIGGEKGLVVPVLREADRLSFAEIERSIRELSDKVKSNRLELSDLDGGTFSITNGGIYGSMLSTPMLNHPQCAILGMHAVQERPVVRGGEIVIRPMMYLALTYDHRLIDGRQAVEFLKRVKEMVEEPEELLLEV
jgi:2-oxoglutarate dehydrogenase E2 component (dihydrolipoamide succinyltransferase)